MAHNIQDNSPGKTAIAPVAAHWRSASQSALAMHQSSPVCFGTYPSRSEKSDKPQLVEEYEKMVIPVSDTLAKKFYVSKSAMRNRLDSLGLMYV